MTENEKNEYSETPNKSKVDMILKVVSRNIECFLGEDYAAIAKKIQSLADDQYYAMYREDLVDLYANYTHFIDRRLAHLENSDTREQMQEKYKDTALQPLVEVLFD